MYIERRDPVRPRKPVTDNDGYTLCLPVPDDAPDPYELLQISGKLRKPSMIHTYTDANGAVLRFIYRFEAGDGLEKKEFRPLTCWRDNSGKLSWRYKDIPENRPLYGLEQLARRPNETVLVVSGEKCADTAKAKLPEYVVVTWSGGDHGISKTDFSPLKNRKLIWWPDNDISGKNAMRMLANIYGGRVLNIDSDKYPKGWDCADAVKDGVDLKSVIDANPMPANSKLLEVKPIDVFMNNLEAAPIDIFVHKTEKGKIISTIANFTALMDYYKLDIWYDVISKSQKYAIAGVRDETQNIDSFYADVRSVCNLNGFPRPDVITFLDRIAMINQKNPVMGWICLRPWDGIARVKEICGSVQCDDSITEHFKNTLIFRWLVSAFAAASRKDNDDFKTRGVLVLQGDQGIGKTTFLRRLCGENYGGDARWFGEGMTLNADNRDSIINAQRFWIVELAELENTTRYSIAGLKAILTNPSNTVRLPYAKAPMTIWSRTVYAGTVNHNDVLPDLTGNTRFWYLPVIKFGDISNIDMQQVWAEIKHYKERGAAWWLTAEEEAMLEDNNREYVVTSPVDELLSEKLDWDTTAPQSEWITKTCTVILKDCGMQNPSQSDARRAAYFMREKLRIKRAPQRGTNGARFYPCPPLKCVVTETDNYTKSYNHLWN
jgi:putative DNA primase/helicase